MSATPPPRAARAHGAARLPRTLGPFSATALVVGLVVGSGIFGVPASVAAQAGSVGAIALLWILGGAIALAGALTLAELAGMFPRAGGIYVYLRETFGPLPAFLFGWGILLVMPASYAAVALIFAASVAALVPMGDATERLVAAGSIAVLAALNARSVRAGAALLNVATVAKAGALLGLSALAFILAEPDAGALGGPITFAPASWSGFGIALIAVMFAYDAWQYAPAAAEEVRDAPRVMPRALFGGVALIVLIYLVVNAANLRVLTLDEMTASRLVSADVAGRLFGTAGVSIIALLVAIATLSGIHAAFMADPRVFFAMARDGDFFRGVSSVHPRWQTPWVAVLVMGTVSIAYVFVRSFEQLAAIFILGMWPFLALAAVAVIVLRRRRPDLPRPFRTPLYPLPPSFFLVAAGALFANALIEQPITTLANFAVLGAGVPAFYLWRALRSR